MIGKMDPSQKRPKCVFIIHFSFYFKISMSNIYHIILLDINPFYNSFIFEWTTLTFDELACTLIYCKAQPRCALLGYPFHNTAAHTEAMPTREGI